MRAMFPIFVAAIVFGCDTTEPPPGELIGGFHFVATLGSPRAAEDRCLFEGAPQQLVFDGVLSYDPSDGKLWITTGNVRREGSISDASFTTRTPTEGPGIVRRMSACSCDFRIAERVEGELLTARSCLPEGVPPVGTTPQACPDVLEDGTLEWSDCGCIRGVIVEEIEFPVSSIATSDGPAPCTCEVAGVEVPAPERCSFVYTLEGSLL